MKTAVIALTALLGLAGCGYGPNAIVQTSTAITIIASGDRSQAAEDMAVKHCSDEGLTARLTIIGQYKSFGVGPIPSYRYECVAKPN